MIEKTYQPSEIERRVWAAWEEARAFRAGRSDRGQAKPYCIIIPPPNVTGSLHMGHALTVLREVFVSTMFFGRFISREIARGQHETIPCLTAGSCTSPTQ